MAGGTLYQPQEFAVCLGIRCLRHLTVEDIAEFGCVYFCDFCAENFGVVRRVDFVVFGRFKGVFWESGCKRMVFCGQDVVICVVNVDMKHTLKHEQKIRHQF